MNEFDRRWQACAARARASEPELPQPPPGLAARAIALAKLESDSWLGSAWERLGWRMVVGAGIVLAVCATLELAAARESHGLLPPVEDTVAQVFWML